MSNTTTTMEACYYVWCDKLTQWCDHVTQDCGSCKVTCDQVRPGSSYETFCEEHCSQYMEWLANNTATAATTTATTAQPTTTRAHAFLEISLEAQLSLITIGLIITLIIIVTAMLTILLSRQKKNKAGELHPDKNPPCDPMTFSGDIGKENIELGTSQPLINLRSGHLYCSSCDETLVLKQDDMKGLQPVYSNIQEIAAPKQCDM